MQNEEEFLLIDEIDHKSDENYHNDSNRIISIAPKKGMICHKYNSKILAFEDIYSYYLKALSVMLLYSVISYINQVFIITPFVFSLTSLILSYIPFALLKVYFLIRETYFTQLNYIGKLLIDIVLYLVICFLTFAIIFFAIQKLKGDWNGMVLMLIALIGILVIFLFAWVSLFVGLMKRNKIKVFWNGLLLLLWLTYLNGFSLMNVLLKKEQQKTWDHFLFTWIIGNCILLIKSYGNLLCILIVICLSTCVVQFVIDSRIPQASNQMLSHSKYLLLIFLLALLMKHFYCKAQCLYQSSTSTSQNEEG